MANLTPEEIHERVLLGLQAARAAAVEKARQTNTLLVIWRDGKVVEVTPDEFEKLGREKSD